MKNEIDWSKAPEGATHGRDHGGGTDFYKRENGVWLYFDHKNNWSRAYGTDESWCVTRPGRWNGEGLPPVSYLRERLRYEEKTGIIVWLPRPQTDFTEKHHFASWVSRCEGKEAGVVVTKKRKKYRRIDICGHKIYAHRVAWAMHYGEHPDAEIDHINGDSMDNSIANLRKVSRQENCQNVKLHADTRSGYCGVNWHEETGKWRARVKINGREKYIGLFDDPNVAAERIKALRDLLGFDSGHGSPIRTPEQIAAEEREKEVAAMSGVVSRACGAILANDVLLALYDAGYRKAKGGAQ